MSRKQLIENNNGESFLCHSCGQPVPPLEGGGNNRNHCPHCLSSVHVDILTGDRKCRCRGVMEAIALWVGGKGEGSLIHRCGKCGFLRVNRIAQDDNELMLFMLAAAPLSQLPFRSKDALGSLKERCRQGEVNRV